MNFMKLSKGRFAASGVAGLTLAVVVVLFTFGVPEQQGCGGSASEPQAAADDEADLTASVCAEQHAGKSHDGESVIVCDKVFDHAPQVKLPADAGSTYYLALQTAGRVTLFIDRNGVEYASTNDKLPAAMKMPSNRSLYFVYKVTGTVGTWTDPISKEKMPSIHVTAAKPYVLLSTGAIDSSA